MHRHFKNRSVLAHVTEKRTEGMLSISESHGREMSGWLSAALDSSREMAIALFLLWIVLSACTIPVVKILIAFGLGFTAWKIGRSARFGWARLERLHHSIEQEKYEIEHHRSQERKELTEIYKAKGFEGELLDNVVNILMADQDRLLKVMLEEELGLTLQAYEHPLKECFGATAGSLISLATTILLFLVSPYGMYVAIRLALTASSLTSAVYEKNHIIPAVIWNISIGILACGISFFLLQILT